MLFTIVVWLIVGLLVGITIKQFIIDRSYDKIIEKNYKFKNSFFLGDDIDWGSLYQENSFDTNKIAVAHNRIWVLSDDEDKIYVYDFTGNRIEEFELHPYDNEWDRIKESLE